MALGKVGKGIIATLATVTLVGGVFAGVYHFVPEVKENVDNTVENLINKIKDKFQGGPNGTNNNGTNNKKDEQQKTEERKDKIQNDERLEGFDDEKKGEIADKFDKVSESDEYKNMSDEEKDKLVDKLIESEVIQEQIKVEQEQQETRKEEVKQELGSLSTELSDILNNNEQTQVEQVSQVANEINNIKQELQDTINSESSSPEEIAAAQEKLEQVEAVEQEYAYNATVDSTKEAVSNSQDFNYDNPGLSIKQINGIYMIGGQIWIDADLIKVENVADVQVYSSLNGFCKLTGLQLPSNCNYQEFVNNISSLPNIISLKITCINNNAESHKQKFESENLTGLISIYRNGNYNFEIIKSWEVEGATNDPEYIIKSTKDEEEKYIFITYEEDHYESIHIKKACPEFWAQKEIEESKQSAEAESVAVEECTERDSEGNVVGFDWNAYLQKNASSHSKVDLDNSQSPSSPIRYADLELSL